MRSLFCIFLSLFLAACGGPQHATVIRAVDGDTLQVRLENGQVDMLGELFHTHWQTKKKRSPHISNPIIDECYETAIKNGALGGKLIGAGGGGFLLLFCAPAKRARVRQSLAGWREIPFKFEPEGSKIIYVT